jgi:serine/threonine-protein kinase RsbW
VSQAERASTNLQSDIVNVRVPADGAYLSVLRTATAGLAARLDFTLDEIEDLRIAVDEACAMLLGSAIAGTDMVCEFELGADMLRIQIGVLTTDGAAPRRDTFAWTVLTSLADDVQTDCQSDNRVTVELRKARSGAAR